MAGAESRLAALEDALAQLAAADAEQVVAEARVEARARVRAVLADALADSLTDAVQRRLAVAPRAPRGGEAPAPPKPPERAPGAAPAAAPATVTAGTYVYGVVWSTDAPFTEDLSGLDADGPVSTVIEGPLAAVVSHVPLAEFEEEELRTHLSDVEWVERVARAHEAVLDDLCARTVVVPMRMCTVYRSDENLRSMLQREEAGLRAALEYLDGKVEWGVKVVARDAPAARPAPDIGAAADDARAATSGADYLARRRARRDEQAELESRHADAAAEIHDVLAALADDGLLNPIQNGELPGHQGRLVMNGVYLVERESTDSFHQEVEELEQRFASLGLELVRTGPWPPYNFVPGDVGAAW
ncbi:MAG TPA: GvpL/GvpF family gas vesicle protein [Solirubrobacteraceae bacterium]|nr:GvpL/GvpF family gas vesicle protein [Solirubrobacteraceae bacterium]